VDRETVDQWGSDLLVLTDSMADLFRRPEPRATFRDFVGAMLSDVPRKNSWALAEQAGHRTPRAFENLLDGAVWDEDRLLDRVRCLTLDGLGDPQAVLVLDDTQCPKRGDKSVGVAPQHSGLTGQTENLQCVVMMTYASVHGHAFINRALYMPRSWTGDPARCRAAGCPQDLVFATKPQLAASMVERECRLGTVFGWVAADSGYGRDPNVREACRRNALRYVLEVPVNFPLLDVYGEPTTPKAVHAQLGAGVWERRSQGLGAKGDRLWDWALVGVKAKGELPADGFVHSLLIRKSKNKVKLKNGKYGYQFAYFLVHAPRDTPLPVIVRVAGTRWKIEDDNGAAKDVLGLDQYQVRKWTPWHRYVTICMLAYAFLAVKRAELGKAHAATRETSAITHGQDACGAACAASNA
jgi:SRSO17 transposase